MGIGADIKRYPYPSAHHKASLQVLPVSSANECWQCGPALRRLSLGTPFQIRAVSLDFAARTAYFV